MVRVIRKIKMARDWFGRICVVFSLRLVGVRGSGPPIFSPSRLCRFPCIGYAIDDIRGDTCKMVRDFNGSIGSSDLNCVRNKGTGFASCAFTCEGFWLIVKFKCAPN